jgi:hypothetical protein
MRERGAPAPPVLVACRDVDAGHIRVFQIEREDA